MNPILRRERAPSPRCGEGEELATGGKRQSIGLAPLAVGNGPEPGQSKAGNSVKNRSKTCEKCAGFSRETRENFLHWGCWGVKTMELWAFSAMASVLLKYTQITVTDWAITRVPGLFNQKNEPNKV
jgi:hypothetical protein